jgi:hypothetical protein
MSNGNVHDRKNPPALLLGKAGGRVKGNTHIAVEKEEPTANCFSGWARPSACRSTRWNQHRKISLA